MQTAWWNNAAALVGMGVFLLVFGSAFPTYNNPVRGTKVGFLTLMGFASIVLGAANLITSLIKRRRVKEQAPPHPRIRDGD